MVIDDTLFLESLFLEVQNGICIGKQHLGTTLFLQSLVEDGRC